MADQYPLAERNIVTYSGQRDVLALAEILASFSSLDQLSFHPKPRGGASRFGHAIILTDATHQSVRLFVETKSKFSPTSKKLKLLALKFCAIRI